jgi:hypothetical protein
MLDGDNGKVARFKQESLSPTSEMMHSFDAPPKSIVPLAARVREATPSFIFVESFLW